MWTEYAQGLARTGKRCGCICVWNNNSKCKKCYKVKNECKDIHEMQMLKISYVTCYVLYTYVFLSITHIPEHAVTLYGQGSCFPQHQSHCLACKRSGEKNKHRTGSWVVLAAVVCTYRYSSTLRYEFNSFCNFACKSIYLYLKWIFPIEINCNRFNLLQPCENKPPKIRN